MQHFDTFVIENKNLTKIDDKYIVKPNSLRIQLNMDNSVSQIDMMYTFSDLIYRIDHVVLTESQMCSPHCKSCRGNHPRLCSPHRSQTSQQLRQEYFINVYITEQLTSLLFLCSILTCGWQGILHKDEYRLLSAELDPLAYHINKLSDCEISGNQIPARVIYQFVLQDTAKQLRWQTTKRIIKD